MKRLALVWGAAAVLGAAAIAEPVKAQEQFNLRFAHYLPKGPFLEVEENFAKRVEERTGGKVKFAITYSGGLGGGNEVLSLVGRGGVDVAAVVPGYYPDQLLFWKATQIPFVFDSPGKAVEVMQASVKEIPAFTEELDKLRVHFLFQQPLGSFYLTGPGENCDTLSGLQGKKVRAFGADIPKVVSAAGATPVTIQVVEIYEALQRKTLDYSFLNLGNISANKLPEVGKYTCGPIMSIGGHMILLNKRVWDRLPPEYQAIIDEEAAKAQSEYVTWQEKNAAETTKVLTDAGAVVKPFNADDLAQWKKQTPDLLQVWADDMTKRGQADAAKAVSDRWREMTK
jgi:TRAP-type C4-dicarboxylate transport system substrate-binding protein